MSNDESAKKTTSQSQKKDKTPRPDEKNFFDDSDAKRDRKNMINAILVVAIIIAASFAFYLNYTKPTDDKNGNGGDGDADDDGMPDEFEDKYGLDKNDPGDAYKDKDGDGYSNWAEYYEGTDPTDKNDRPVKGRKITSIIPPRAAGIINGHEHIQDFEQAGKWLAAMDMVNVSTTVMLGSPEATFYLHPSGPFTKYNESNEELFKLVDKYPDRFIAFPTIYTWDEDKLQQLKDYIQRGAIGLKLFTGHFASFYDALGPLNHTTMYPLYAYCEQEQIPIIWHVHLGQEKLRKEFEEVLEDFPNLILNIPHFMLSSINLWQSNGTGRLRHFLEKYPNLYTDVSFGYWAQDGLWRISNHTKVYRDFMIEFQDRFTFGTDMVCTSHPRKDPEWIANLTMGYTDILETDHFNLFVKGDIEGDFNGELPGTHSGLKLPQDVLDKIYYDNMVKFLCGRYAHEDLSTIIKESDLKIQEYNFTRSESQEEIELDIEDVNSELTVVAAEEKRIIIC